LGHDGAVGMNSFDKWFLQFTADWRNPVGVAVVAAVFFLAILYWEYTRFMLKSLRRNLLRSVLTGLATFALVFIFAGIWSILTFLDTVMETKTRNLKAIITERYQVPSMMPMSYERALAEGAARKPGDYRVDPDKDAMYWAFYGGTIDPAKRTRENLLFFFAMDPRKLLSVDAQGRFSSMMDGLEEVSDEDKYKLAAACEEMDRYPYKVLMGVGRLQALNKRVGERVKVTSMNYEGIDLEFEIMGMLPGGRYEQSAVMSYKYLEQALKKYEKDHGQKHKMDDKSLALEWVRVPDTQTFDRVAEQIHTSPEFRSPAVKCETASSGIASFLDPYKDLLFGVRWYLAPAIVMTLVLVIANAISISVRERRTEMAVLKVLGFTPNQILVLVLSEALLIGGGTGLLSGWLARHIVNELIGGIALPIAFFGKFFISSAAPWWGLTIGACTALVGSILPAWSARSVKVSEVFSKIA
jgi:putative ABC transport system permease protein